VRSCRCDAPPMPKDETELRGQVFVIEATTFMLVAEGIDVEKIAAEHGGELVGHFPDAEILEAKVHAIRRATAEELAELGS
jgi:hypothetical protein